MVLEKMFCDLNSVRYAVHVKFFPLCMCGFCSDMRGDLRLLALLRRNRSLLYKVVNQIFKFRVLIGSIGVSTNAPDGVFKHNIGYYASFLNPPVFSILFRMV